MASTARTGSPLPVAVIGAGPIGLTAAAHLHARGRPAIVLEAGARAGTSIRSWSHVGLFSAWRELVDPTVRELLLESGWSAPDARRAPTGGELLERLVDPLAAHPAIAPMLRLGHRVTAVTRAGIDKVKDRGRAGAPFRLRVQRPDDTVHTLLASAVIDASGTYTNPNPLGADGYPADGERTLAGRIRYGIPDLLGAERRRYAGLSTAVVGSGHSAFQAVLELASLAEGDARTRVTWLVRRRELNTTLFGGGAEDRLAARGALGARVRKLVTSGRLRVEVGVEIDAVGEDDGQVRLESIDGRVLGPFDHVVATTGYRPDLEMTRELRLDLDPSLEAPRALAPMIDPNVHSCGTVPPHGARELAHPEPGFYTVGMKSYGRAPTFLLLTGYEQVRSVVCELIGDHAGARAVMLELPETGVCGVGGPTMEPARGCCDPSRA